MTVLIPQGLEPLAVWDCNDGTSIWHTSGRKEEMAAWADERIPDLDRTIRIDFYLLDAPFAAVYRLERAAAVASIAAMRAAMEKPFVVPLGELPPAHLMGG